MDEDITEIETVLKLATAIGYYESPDIIAARKFRKQRAERMQLASALEAAIVSHDVHVLRAIVDQADATGFKGHELARAKGFLQALRLKSAALEQLEIALSNDSTEALEIAIKEARKHSVDEASLQKASAKLSSLLRFRAALGKIEAACAENNRARLEAALQAAAQEGGRGGEIVKVGEATLAKLVGVEELSRAIDSATEALENFRVTLSEYERLKTALEAPELAEENLVRLPRELAKDIATGDSYSKTKIQYEGNDSVFLDVDAARNDQERDTFIADNIDTLMKRGKQLLQALDDFLSLEMDKDNHFSNCPCLKSCEEWTSTLPKISITPLSENSRNPQAQFLTHQSIPLHTSLSKHPDTNCNAQERVRVSFRHNNPS